MAAIGKTLAVSLILSLFTIAPAMAGVAYEFITNNVEFMEEYPGLARQDFSAANVGSFDSKACPSPANSSSDNDCFTPGVIDEGLQISTVIPAPQDLRLIGSDFPMLGNAENVLIVNNPLPLNVFFDDPAINVVGLLLGCVEKSLTPCNEQVLVEVFNTNTVIGSTTVIADDGFDTFLGISSPDRIARIRISQANPLPEEDIFPGLTAIYYGSPAPAAVPAISEWGLIATASVLGIIALIAVRRRKLPYNE